MRHHRLAASQKPAATGKQQPPSLWELPPLCSSEQLGAALQCSSRTILNWSKGTSPKIPMAFQLGKVIRYDPREIARALGIPVPAGTAPVGLNGQGQSESPLP